MYIPKSEKELEVIRTLMEYPERNWSLKQISEESGVSKTTVWRSVNRLEDQNFLKVSQVGNSKMIEVNNRDILRRILELSVSDVREMKEIAKKFVDETKKMDKVEKCILFGSVARGTADLNSDIDVLILLGERDEELEDKISQIAEQISSERSVRIMPDLMEEGMFEFMKKHEDPFAENIEKEGIQLYEADEDEQTS